MWAEQQAVSCLWARRHSSWKAPVSRAVSQLLSTKCVLFFEEFSTVSSRLELCEECLLAYVHGAHLCAAGGQDGLFSLYLLIGMPSL